MTYQELIDFYGSEVKAAADIEVSQMTITKFKNKEIPRLYQLAFQTLTKNKLKED